MNKKPFKASDGPKIMLIAFALMLAAQVVVSFALVPFMFAENDAMVEILSYVGMIAFQAVFLTAYLVYTKKKNVKSSFSPRNKITLWCIPAAILIGFICIFCFMGPANLFDMLLSKIGYVSQELEINSGVSIALIVFATVFAAPICEETIYRSALLSGITKTRTSDLCASLLCGLCFALMHISPEQTVYQFCLGAVAAYVVINCRSVIPAMIIHSVSNALALVMSFTNVGMSIYGFYMNMGNVFIALLTCIMLPVVACAAIWFICLYLKKAEQKKYPNKYEEPKVVWIDEQTREPVYEGEPTPEITEQNRLVQRGYSPFTGAPVFVDRLEEQNSLMAEYQIEAERDRINDNKPYKTMLRIYMILTAIMWLFTFGLNFLS